MDLLERSILLFAFLKESVGLIGWAGCMCVLWHLTQMSAPHPAHPAASEFFGPVPKGHTWPPPTQQPHSCTSPTHQAHRCLLLTPPTQQPQSSLLQSPGDTHGPRPPSSLTVAPRPPINLTDVCSSPHPPSSLRVLWSSPQGTHMHPAHPAASQLHPAHPSAS